MDAERSLRTMERIPDPAVARLDTDQLVWSVARRLGGSEVPLVACRNLDDKGISEVFVYADDFDGLFALTAREFDRMELNVLAARVATTDDGHSWDLFQIMDANGRALNASDRSRLAEALTRQLGERDIRPLPGRPIPRRLKHFLTRSEIVFHDGADSTRLEIATTDRPGLLSAIAESLLGAGVRLHDARIATFGQRVEDVFVITTREGRVLDEAAASMLEQELRKRLDPETEPRSGRPVVEE
jgi:[protein-PII] uridylyltransferase